MPKLLTSLLIAVNLWGSVCACADDNTQMLASVRVGRGGGCSGTVFATDDDYAYVLSASHCVSAIGNRVGIGTVDGITHDGEWIARDNDLDLSIARFPRVGTLAVTPISPAMPTRDGTWSAIGFPATSGPNFKSVGPADVVTNTNVATSRWSMRLLSGTFGGGDSGGGIFKGPHLIGVMTHGHEGHEVQGAAHNQLLTFVESVPAAAKAMAAECPDGKCEVCPKCGKVHPPKDWKPQPNRPIVLPDKTPRDGTFGDKDASTFIVELTKKIKALEDRVAALEAKKPDDAKQDAPPPPIPMKGEQGPRGLTGEPGPAGRDGKDGKPGLITVVLKWADGKPIAEVPDVPSGKRVTQILERVTK